MKNKTASRMGAAAAKACAAALALFLFAGCGGSGGSQASVTPSPTPTPTPVVTMEPTPAPDLPKADPSLLPFYDIRSLGQEEWPAECALRFQHESGVAAQASALFTRGEEFSLYLFQDLREKTFERFTLEGDRVLPDRGKLLDAGEGLVIGRSSADVAQAMDALIAQSEDDLYVLTMREGIGTWNSLYGFEEEPDRGAIPYQGEFAILEQNRAFVRYLFALRATDGVRTVVMQVYEPTSEPPMFHYLCAMLATLRFQ